jgi:hypothetical protein
MGKCCRGDRGVRRQIIAVASLLVVAISALSASWDGRADQRTTVEKPRVLAQGVVASELDPTLPNIPVGDWLRSSVGTKDEIQWTQTACPATHEELGSNRAEWPVCVLATVGVSARPGPERPLAARQGELVVALSIRLGTGNPNTGAWQTERPQIEDAFVERDGDSVTVPYLRDLPALLRLPPERWPKGDLSVSTEDIRCDNSSPTPGETVTCQVAIRNTGPAEALVRTSAYVIARGGDIGAAKSLPLRRLSADERAVLSWDWAWPKGTAWRVQVAVELYTPHAYGGYRIPVKERNVQNNRASATFGSWSEPPPETLGSREAPRLRITNTGPGSVEDLIVVFPHAQVSFGDVRAGTTTGYRAAPAGVYRYAAYRFRFNGKPVQQMVMDWVGETPMEGQAFTYTIEVEVRPTGAYIKVTDAKRER